MVRHAPIHRRSGHSDIAICCGRNVRGSSPSTSVVPLSNQVTTLNHKRFKGFKMFSDGHLLRIQSNMVRTRWRLDEVHKAYFTPDELRKIGLTDEDINRLQANSCCRKLAYWRQG